MFLMQNFPHHNFTRRTLADLAKFGDLDIGTITPEIGVFIASNVKVSEFVPVTDLAGAEPTAQLCPGRQHILDKSRH